jgi:hypothetical protein
VSDDNDVHATASEREQADELPLPAEVAKDEVVISVQPEGVLVGGDPEAVENYLIRIREAAGRAVGVVGIDKAAVGGAAGLVGGAAAVLGQSGKFVQLHAQSVEALKVGKAIPGTDGFYRMMTRGSDGKFLKQLQWKPAELDPQRLMAVQTVAVQIALTSAIAQVEDSIRRVEGKVEAVLRLAEANRAGDVLGNYTIIDRRMRYLGEYGSLPDALWESVSGLGPALNVTVEQLRAYVGRTLASFKSELPVQDRARLLHGAVDDKRLNETLELLVVAEESLFKWQRLLLARVGATQPEHLPNVIQQAREVLAHNVEQDGAIYRRAKDVVEDFARIKDIDGFRYWSVRALARDRQKLREALDHFAYARRKQVDTWEDIAIPGLDDAASATVELAKKSTSRALAAAGQGLIKLGDFLNEERGEREPVIKSIRRPRSQVSNGHAGTAGGRRRHLAGHVRSRCGRRFGGVIGW